MTSTRGKPSPLRPEFALQDHGRGNVRYFRKIRGHQTDQSVSMPLHVVAETLSIMTLSITTLSICSLIVTPSICSLIVTLSITMLVVMNVTLLIIVVSFNVVMVIVYFIVVLSKVALF